ncbi:uncharacterized protein A4U43_C01F5240 [Asparagus officinalis]|uniref:FBD domain-containing protein n=1 Tax=Asparagus officinalis TaxID=4686 RepID=A0A5P1FPH0_ASPOF|nr:F-box/FBD/LRR-repeat protein At1g13570-like [Asparagus officinalis]ONK79327.1 uncharacterized protein A4U43_C01F5240 [Asparagus officinalis]
MNSDLDTDRLSSLPKNVIETILMRMPIRDAVRTSILSRGWRFEWSTLPQIVIDTQPLLSSLGGMQMELDKKIVKTVDHILLLHHGPIHKFTLSIDLESSSDIDRWILFLSRNGIKEFSLLKWRGQLYKLPSYFFSWDITYLELYRCAFIPPTSFKGFSRLTVMTLDRVSFTDNGLATLMSLCPLLKELVLRQVTGCTHLNISAQKIVKVVIQGSFHDIRFESTPLLATASIKMLEVAGDSLVSKEDCRIVRVLGDTPSIYQLELLGPTLKNLAVGDVPVHLAAICPVKYLIIDINFEATQEMLAAFCMFRSSPAVQKLGITAISDKKIATISSDGFWEGEESFNCTFSQLKVVEVTDFSGITSELKLIEFVLANSPVLERLHIKFKENVAHLVKILKELNQYRRVSPKAKLFFPG